MNRLQVQILSLALGGYMAGKGDTYRPVDKKKWDSNWDLAFGKSKKSKSKGKKNINTPKGTKNA
jgi:hypothetical protein|tara:strand:- start:22 stop:213 length:192 start_codon:yes stop_codon:yes gene_type:complete